MSVRSLQYRVHQLWYVVSPQYFKCGTKPVTPSSASKSFPDKSISIMDVSVEGGERGREVGGGEGEGEGGGKCEGEGEGGRRGEGEGEGGKAGGEVVVKEEEVEGEAVEDKERDVDSTIEETKTRKRRRTEVWLMMYSYFKIMYIKYRCVYI